jgi:hypothetical protein
MCCRSAGPVAQKEFLERLQEENRASASPWPECKRCGFAVDPQDMSWLYINHCDSHGMAKLDALVRKIVRRHGRRRTLRVLKRLAR